MNSLERVTSGLGASCSGAAPPRHALSSARHLLLSPCGSRRVLPAAPHPAWGHSSLVAAAGRAGADTPRAGRVAHDSKPGRPAQDPRGRQPSSNNSSGSRGGGGGRGSVSGSSGPEGGGTKRVQGRGGQGQPQAGKPRERAGAGAGAAAGAAGPAAQAGKLPALSEKLAARLRSQGQSPGHVASRLREARGAAEAEVEGGTAAGGEGPERAVSPGPATGSVGLGAAVAVAAAAGAAASGAAASGVGTDSGGDGGPRGWLPGMGGQALKGLQKASAGQGGGMGDGGQPVRGTAGQEVEHVEAETATRLGVAGEAEDDADLYVAMDHRTDRVEGLGGQQAGDGTGAEGGAPGDGEAGGGEDEDEDEGDEGFPQLQLTLPNPTKVKVRTAEYLQVCSGSGGLRGWGMESGSGLWALVGLGHVVQRWGTAGERRTGSGVLSTGRALQLHKEGVRCLAEAWLRDGEVWDDTG